MMYKALAADPSLALLLTHGPLRGHEALAVLSPRSILLIKSVFNEARSRYLGRAYFLFPISKGTSVVMCQGNQYTSGCSCGRYENRILMSIMAAGKSAGITPSELLSIKVGIHGTGRAIVFHAPEGFRQNCKRIQYHWLAHEIDLGRALAGGLKICNNCIQGIIRSLD